MARSAVVRSVPMRTRLLVTAVALALAAAACGGGGDQSAQTGAVDEVPEADETVLDFRAETVDGSTVDVNSLQGTDLVIWFWAPW